MFVVGKPTIAGKRLCDLAFKTMWAGIEAVRPGGTFNDIGVACQAFADKNGISVVRDYGGHGIGRGFHEEPHVHHFPINHPTPKFVPGMVFTIEPMAVSYTHLDVYKRQAFFETGTRLGATQVLCAGNDPDINRLTDNYAERCV